MYRQQGAAAEQLARLRAGPPEPDMPCSDHLLPPSILCAAGADKELADLQAKLQAKYTMPAN